MDEIKKYIPKIPKKIVIAICIVSAIGLLMTDSWDDGKNRKRSDDTRRKRQEKISTKKKEITRRWTEMSSVL